MNLFLLRKENTALRANVRPDLISVIPNAVDTAIFKPDETKRNASKGILSKEM